MPVDPAHRQYLSSENWEAKLRDGDMIFIRSHTANAPYIAMLSNPDAAPDDEKVFTHCGLVFREQSRWKVYEGAGRGSLDNVLTLKQWQIHEADGHGSHVFVRRWAATEELTSEKLAQILARAKELHATSYDTGFSWTDSKVYCSELIWKAYNAASLPPIPLPKLKKYMEALTKEQALKALEMLSENRGGAAVDSEEFAVSPEDIYQSEKLVSVNDDTP